MLPYQKACGWSHQTKMLVTVYWLACEALCKATVEISAMPEVQLARLSWKWWLSSKEKFSCSGHKRWETSSGCFAGCGAFCTVWCHIRIVSRAEQQKKCYVNPQSYCRVCDARGAFLDINLPKQHPCMTDLSSAGPLLKKVPDPPDGLFL